MKKVCATKDRPGLRPEQAEREVFIHMNLAPLDAPTGEVDVLHDVRRFGNADDDTAIIADEDSAVPAAGENPASDGADVD